MSRLHVGVRDRAHHSELPHRVLVLLLDLDSDGRAIEMCSRNLTSDSTSDSTVVITYLYGTMTCDQLGVQSSRRAEIADTEMPLWDGNTKLDRHPMHHLNQVRVV